MPTAAAGTRSTATLKCELCKRMKTTPNRARPGCREWDAGQAMVEFLLTVVFLTLLMVSVLEMAGFIYTYSVLANAAKEGVRYAIVHGASNSSPSGPTTAVATSSPPCTSSNTRPTTEITNVQSRVRDFAAFSLHKIST